MLIKKRIFSGVVCEQEVYFTAPVRAGGKLRVPRIRFKSEAERERHRIEISRRLHTRLFNENFSPASLYSTLTLDDEHEVYSFDDMKKIRDLGRNGPWCCACSRTSGACPKQDTVY